VKLLVLSHRDVRDLVTMATASEAMKTAFAALSTGTANAPARGHIDARSDGSETLLMGAYVPNMGLAAKIVSHFPGNQQLSLPVVQGLIVVLDEQTGVPKALCDGTALTALRTGAGTCASIDLLARPDATTAALFGTGGQAPTQLLALDTARSLSAIRIYALDAKHGREFIEEQQPHIDARLELAQSPDAAIDGADIVVTATNSSRPVFDGRLLASGTHVVAVGSISPTKQEVDSVTLERSRVFVDSKQGALAEAGELIQAIDAGITSADEWTELGLVAAERAPGRTDADQITFYKSVGHAVQDVAIAHLVVSRAEQLGAGVNLEL